MGKVRFAKSGDGFFKVCTNGRAGIKELTADAISNQIVRQFLDKIDNPNDKVIDSFSEFLNIFLFGLLVHFSALASAAIGCITITPPERRNEMFSSASVVCQKTNRQLF